MSQPISDDQRPARSLGIHRRFGQFSGWQGIAMFGAAEVAALLASTLLLAIVVFSYFYFLAPAQRRLESLARERARSQTLLRSSHDVIRKDEDAKAVVERIAGSLQDFESNRLTEHTQGRMKLYDELNELIRKNGLRNTSGPTYTTLDPAGSQSARKSTSTKWQSVYPGIAVAVTVEGQYQNLRHFMRDIENSKQFIIINGIELERATETNAPVSADAAPAGARASLVSLRMDLATYFQRTTNTGGAVIGEQK